MNNNYEVAIKVEHLKKHYTLGEYDVKTFVKSMKNVLNQKKRTQDIQHDYDAQIVGQTIKALDDVNFSINSGEVIGIIGGNGSGKSTLLKLISKITVPTSGEIGINGRVASLLEVGTGFNPAMTGRENIYLNGAILGMTIAEIDEKLDRIIEFSECYDFIDTPVKRYSSGMYVKLAFSIAVHLNSEILILDEVLAVGDIKFQTKCLKKMQEIANDQHRTILFVSHNMSMIRKLCTRCVVLKKGKLIFDGNTSDAVNMYLGNSNEFASYYNLESIDRPSDSHGKYMKILSVQFEQEKGTTYVNGDKIRFDMKWISDIDAEKMFLRTEVISADEIPVGVAESISLGKVHAKQMRLTRFTLDTHNFGDGKFYMVLDLYTKHEDGLYLSYDHPLIEIPFTIAPIRRGELFWDMQAWGNIRFNVMEAEEIKLESESM